ncbi:MAG TPA: hypothetical protein VNQ74_08855, partial [Burkholderiaceae bacterium]|nr:hypothetical protein [Burkholderiaceae bacterium]
RDTAATPIETVQHRQTPRQNQRYHANRYRNGYNAYASQNGAGGSANAVNPEIIPGWRCEARSAGEGGYSAYPSWDICDDK